MAFNAPQQYNSSVQPTGAGGFKPPIAGLGQPEAQPEHKSVGGFIKNVGSSALGLAEGIGTAIIHPIDTVTNIAKVGIGGAEKLIPGQQGQEKVFNAAVEYFKQRYGGFDKVKETAYKDPLGFALDLSMVLTGGGSAIAKVGELADVAKGAAAAGDVNKIAEAAKVAETATKVAEPVNAITKVGEGVKAAGEAIDPFKVAGKAVKPVITKVAGASELAKKLATFGASTVTGLAPDTIKNVIEHPDNFSGEAMQGYTREGVASQILGDVQNRINQLSDTGKEYGPIRDAKTPVVIPQGTFEGVLEKHGIQVGQDGKLIFNRESIPTSPGDQSALQHWYDTYGKDGNHTSNSFLNARKGLDNLAQFDTSKTDAANVLARDLRSTLNEVGRPQVPALEAQDAKFSSEISELKKVKSDYFNGDGTLKDGAISKIANLTNKGRDLVLQRLEVISPGAADKIRTMKAVEDIQNAGGAVKTIRRGAEAIGALTLNPTMVITAALTEPKFAVAALRGYAKTMNLSAETIDRIMKDYEALNPSKFKKLIPDAKTATEAGKLKNATEQK